MELRIKGKNIDITDSLRQHIEKKFSRLDRRISNILQAKIEAAYEMTKSPQQRYVVQVTLDVNGTILRGEQRAADLYTAIDSVADVIDRQVERYKGKLQQKPKGTSPLKSESTTSVTEEERRIVKTKSFPIKPMPTTEAIEQMALLGHYFFIFINEKSGRLNVVYQREDGNYGLIEPEIT